METKGIRQIVEYQLENSDASSWDTTYIPNKAQNFKLKISSEAYEEPYVTVKEFI